MKDFKRAFLPQSSGSADKFKIILAPANAANESTCPEYYEKALQHLDDIMEFVLDNKLLDINPIYNINIPENPKGIRITRQGGSYYSDDFVHIGDGLYRPTGKCVYEDTNDDTLDSDSVMRGYITIMPLTIDRTNYEAYNKLKSLLK